VVGLVVASIVLAACGRDDSGGGGGDESGAKLASAPGFDGKRFKWGLLTVTSGPAAGANAPSLAGIQTYVKALNAKGGIAGKYPVDLVLRDMQYDPAKTVQAYNATHNDVALYAQVFGTPMTKAILPQLKQDKIIVVPGSADGSFWHEQNVVVPFTPYESQLINGVSYMDDKLEGKGKKVCGAGGEGALAETVERIVKYVGSELDHPTGPTVSLATANQNYTPQMQQLRREGCDVVLIIASPVPVVSGALTSAARLNLDAQWLAPPTGFVSAVKKAPVFNYMKDHFLMTSDGTVYGDTEHATGMQELMDAHDKYAKDTLPEWSYVNGWVSTLMLDQVVTKAVGNADVSREGIIEALNSIEKFDLKGIQFSPAWGAPEARKVPDQFGIFELTDDADIGIAAKEYGLEAPAPSLSYPYANAEG
jgi:ABC-type branched-subunit amino acid transport system substrate-binding protein